MARAKRCREILYHTWYIRTVNRLVSLCRFNCIQTKSSVQQQTYLTSTLVSTKIWKNQDCKAQSTLRIVHSKLVKASAWTNRTKLLLYHFALSYKRWINRVIIMIWCKLWWLRWCAFMQLFFRRNLRYNFWWRWIRVAGVLLLHN
ncbi:hypothetical protein K450DRAFT_241812 [Umbelopsis ramanniana AG]|uniref:Uncharacterized protein n=1 Tax=Umbelopsis ramanniana AG TaxID=1314678 RepID=A0AAD5E9Z1_UMBRA|nr:uncharacterized protein K450DRAFT_241812 [Umbelopsis ramanniana AG]KAI8579609.1 hypothetical protein K450DRAFT_241812 [Umbelopsis ramanniana AG]